MQQEADVLICLEDRIEDQCEQIVRKAQEEAKAMRKQAEREAETIISEAKAKTESKLVQIRSRRKSQAALESAQLLTKVKAEAVGEAIKLAGSRLQNEYSSPRYKSALEKFLTEALEALKPSSGPFRVITRKEDEPHVKQLVSGKRINASVESAPADFPGGLEIVDEKSRIRVVNTFESRLRQGYETISDHVRKVLSV